MSFVFVGCEHAKKLIDPEDTHRRERGLVQCLLCRARHKRHSFAVHRLTSWYQQGKDVQKLLPQLATYLGHTKLAATQEYLTMTPQLLHEASVRFEQYAFQEVRHD